MSTPHEDPRWPAFKRWADENTPGLMLHTYWACWQAAHLTGYQLGQQHEYRAAQGDHRHLRYQPPEDHSTLTAEDLGV